MILFMQAVNLLKKRRKSKDITNYRRIQISDPRLCIFVDHFQ